MDRMVFTVTPVWDEEAGVFYSDSDIKGLHVEAATLEEFVSAVQDLAPALVLENHLTKRDLAQRSIFDLIPSIFLRMPPYAPPVAAE
jgi:hypothetical protein